MVSDLVLVDDDSAEEQHIQFTLQLVWRVTVSLARILCEVHCQPDQFLTLLEVRTDCLEPLLG
ncbi:hypothetical protein [Nesterenkonia flava]|uniref:Uncharacterized protein n=1 Tax=Nesterenkonia flava TaxID=469799 RepID=A0ABU1FTN6_9MICC|nr:hypothetical protein [Nesterenkonia flava]